MRKSNETSEAEIEQDRYRVWTEGQKMELDLAKYRLAKSEDHALRLQETIDQCLRVQRGPPVGFCDVCTKLWIDRSKEAVEQIRKIMESR